MVVVRRHAIAPVTVAIQSNGVEWRTDSLRHLSGSVENRDGNGLDWRVEAIRRHQSGHVNLSLVHLPPNRAPAHRIAEFGEPGPRDSCAHEITRIGDAASMI